MSKESKERRMVAWVCPGCGEQISGHARTDRCGHYHSPPEGWWTEDGPGPENVNGEDPWVDAVEVQVVPASQLQALQSSLREEVERLRALRHPIPSERRLADRLEQHLLASEGEKDDG